MNINFLNLRINALVISLFLALSANATVYISGEPSDGWTTSGNTVTITKNGSYKLTANSVGNLVISNGVVAEFDLNGFELLNKTASGNASYIIRNLGGTLSLYDKSTAGTGAINGNGGSGTWSNVTGRAIRNQDGGTIYFYSGIIKNCWTEANGGGIGNLTGCTVYMKGGTIQDCRADAHDNNKDIYGGGGVYNAGTFYFEGGTIKDCVTKSYPGSTNKHIGGGGIYNFGGDADHAGMLYMSGGIIENCIATRSAEYSGVPSRAHGGGGVLNVGTGAKTLPSDRGVFVMTGGTIKGCEVRLYQRGCGGGVFNAEGSFYLKGGTIGGDSEADGNTVPAEGSSYGGGICSRGEYFKDRTSEKPTSNETNAYFEMTGGKVAYNKSPNYSGGGICINFGSAKITGGLITHNKAGALGGGIIGGNATNVIFGGTAEVSYNEVTNALGYTSDPDCGGGGIAVGKASGSNEFTMTGGKVIHNTCDGKGGGIYLRDVSTSGQSNDIKIEDGVIADNTAGTAGGGIFSSGKVDVSGGTIKNNNAGTNGGGICLGAESQFTMSNGEFTENKANVAGGGVYIIGKKDVEVANFTGGTFYKNTSGGNGGGFYIQNGNVTVKAGTIGANEAANYGGGFYLGGGNIQIDGGTISENNAVDGGAAFIASSDCKVTMKNGTVTLNTATNNGGAFYVNGNFTFDDGSLSQNTSSNNGGGAYINGGSVQFNNGSLDSNTALNGGGIYLSSGAKMTFTDGLIARNRAIKNSNEIPTAYNAMTDVPKVNGCGGGIYLQSGKSKKTTTLTINVAESFGLYSNTAERAGDDIVAEGVYTSVTVPNVKKMDLKDFEGKSAKPNWYEDYVYPDADGDTQYKDHGILKLPSGSGNRFHNMIESGEYSNHLVEFTEASKTFTDYVCLTLGYQAISIIVKTRGLNEKESILYVLKHLVKPVGSEEYEVKETYPILLNGMANGTAVQKIVKNVLPGRYVVEPVGLDEERPWAWAYTFTEPVSGKIEKDVVQEDGVENLFPFEVRHVEGDSNVKHDEEYKVNSFISNLTSSSTVR